MSTIAGMCWPRWAQRIKGFTVIPEGRIAQTGLHDAGIQEDGDPRGGIGTLVGPPEVAVHGFERAFVHALDVLAAQTDRTYPHFDVDVIDPRTCGETSTQRTAAPGPNN